MPTTLDVFRGYPIRESVTLYQDAAMSVPVNLTGSTVTGGIGRVGEAPLVPLTCAIVDALNGEILITAAGEDSAALGGSLFPWGIVVTDTLGHPNPIPLGDASVHDAPVLPTP